MTSSQYYLDILLLSMKSIDIIRRYLGKMGPEVRTNTQSSTWFKTFNS